MYVAGDHLKFGFPMAFTATILSWTILEYGEQMKAVNQMEPARDSLKWITEYLVNPHPSDDVLHVLVGNPKLDHRCWDRPENMTKQGPLTQVNASAPGTEAAAETAAALASASLVFKDIDSSYSNLLLWPAKLLFTFADRYIKSYSISIPNVQKFYNSTSYRDELLWAASWRYHATGERFYFEYVTGKMAKISLIGEGGITWFRWDNKLAGAHVLFHASSNI